MAKFAYKTKNGMDPSTLQKVWVCAHSDDIINFLENDIDKIFSLVNCAIWYDECPKENYDEEELLESLSDMQLFIVPVTYKFLTEENRALSIELPYAIENKIPILPLIKDTALTNLFNEKCGFIQYLSLENEDDTSITYDEKLKKYISNILLDEEITKKIRSAFDAYIFLSYRKKDRKYANQLMKLIHQNDFCRDIAIWYDEFLTPGENFNEEISKFIEKSCILALAVTPNILEENNYVLTQEYPMALEKGLNILPAEMVKTDLKELNKKYGHLPELTNAYDGKSLSLALLNALSDVAIRTNDNDPVHNFFIGLAYLGGIDVEIDKKRALELIEESSSSGLLEATLKLINMYKYGDGVERDFNMAIFMAERLISQTREIYLKDESLENYLQFINSFNILTTQLIEQGKYNKAIEVCNFNHQLIKESLNKFDHELNYHYFDMLVKKGWYLYKMRDYESAKECYEEYLLNISLYMKHNPTFIEVNQNRINLLLVDVLFRIGDFVSGNKILIEVENNLSKIKDDTLDNGYILQNLKTYHSLGELMRIKGQYEKSLMYYRRSNECYLRLKSILPIEEQLNQEFLYYNSVANVLYLMNKIDEAEMNYDISQKIVTEYYEKTGHLMSIEKLATTILNKADIALSRSKFKEAEEYLNISLSKFKEISDICNSVYSITKQCIIFSKLSTIAKNLGKMKEALNYINHSINYLTKLIEKRNDMTFCYMLGNAYNDYALLLDKCNRKQEAYESYKKASKYHEIASSISNLLIIYVARSYKLEGDYAMKIGLNQEAIKAYEKSFDYYMQCGGQNDDIYDLIYLCEILSKGVSKEDVIGFNSVLLRCYDRLLKRNDCDEKLLDERKKIALKQSELLNTFEEEEDSIDYDLDEIVNSVFNDK